MMQHCFSRLSDIGKGHHVDLYKNMKYRASEKIFQELSALAFDHLYQVSLLSVQQ